MLSHHRQVVFCAGQPEIRYATQQSVLRWISSVATPPPGDVYRTPTLSPTTLLPSTMKEYQANESSIRTMLPG